MESELNELQSCVNVFTQSRSGGGEVEVSDVIRERLERLETKVSSVQSHPGESDGGGVTPRQVAEAPAVMTLEKRVGELKTDMTEVEEYMYEWHESAETYLRALRKVVEEKLGVSLQSYLQAGEDDVEEDVETSSQ